MAHDRAGLHRPNVPGRRVPGSPVRRDLRYGCAGGPPPPPWGEAP